VDEAYEQMLLGQQELFYEALQAFHGRLLGQDRHANRYYFFDGLAGVLVERHVPFSYVSFVPVVETSAAAPAAVAAPTKSSSGTSSANGQSAVTAAAHDAPIGMDTDAPATNGQSVAAPAPTAARVPATAGTVGAAAVAADAAAAAAAAGRPGSPGADGTNGLGNGEGLMDVDLGVLPIAVQKTKLFVSFLRDGSPFRCLALCAWGVVFFVSRPLDSHSLCLLCPGLSGAAVGAAQLRDAPVEPHHTHGRYRRAHCCAESQGRCLSGVRDFAGQRLPLSVCHFLSMS
jgi:hypothetical protein